MKGGKTLKPQITQITQIQNLLGGKGLPAIWQPT
jgi:hypothetical protein